jgi:hypothetical protein
LPDGTLQNVPLGVVLGFRAGAYVNQDVNATIQIVGDSNGVFRVLRLETDDVVFIDDPDLPPGHQRVQVLETAIKVEGPGPIPVTTGQAIIVDVEFSCPNDPQQGAFKATLSVAGIAIPIVATPNLGFLYGNVLTSPSDLAPGESANCAFELFSSMGHAVNVAVAYDSAFGNQFSAPTSQVITVPPAGGTAHLTIPVTCAPGTPEGVYPAEFQFISQDGTPFERSIEFGTQITVIGGTIVTRIDTTSVVMVAGGITPINLTIQSVRGGGTDVSYRLAGPPELGLSGPPIHVDAGKTTHGTVWLEASLDAPQDATVQLTQFSFTTQGQLIPEKIFVSAFSPPAGDDFVVFRVYWGPKWTVGNPFSWQQMEKAIFTVVRSAFVKGFREYGVASVSDVAVSNLPGLPITTFPSVALEVTFPSSNDFDESDITGLITSLLDFRRLPRPDEIEGTPYYCVMPQQGSFYRPNPTGLCGRHDTFSYLGTKLLYAWVYQATTVDGTTPCFGHELAEAICAKGAGMEIGDPCQNLQGRSNGVALEAYLSKQRNLCVLPDMTNNPDIAATAPVPGKTGG